MSDHEEVLRRIFDRLGTSSPDRVKVLEVEELLRDAGITRAVRPEPVVSPALEEAGRRFRETRAARERRQNELQRAMQAELRPLKQAADEAYQELRARLEVVHGGAVQIGSYECPDPDWNSIDPPLPNPAGVCVYLRDLRASEWCLYCGNPSERK